MAIVNYTTSALDPKTTVVAWIGCNAGDQMQLFPSFAVDILSLTAEVLSAQTVMDKWMVSNNQVPPAGTAPSPLLTDPDPRYSHCAEISSADAKGKTFAYFAPLNLFPVGAGSGQANYFALVRTNPQG